MITHIPEEELRTLTTAALKLKYNVSSSSISIYRRKANIISKPGPRSGSKPPILSPERRLEVSTYIKNNPGLRANYIQQQLNITKYQYRYAKML